jgi:ComF family protein
MVQAFKYGDRLDLAPAMGRWMAQAGQELLAEANALIPVPLHWRRLWSRRFNQTATLARTISQVSGVPVAYHALRRVRATRQQVGLTQAERAVNVQGAFRVTADRRHETHGQRVVIVDDVLTSGATLDTCARILLRALVVRAISPCPINHLKIPSHSKSHKCQACEASSRAASSISSTICIARPCLCAHWSPRLRLCQSSYYTA